MIRPENTPKQVSRALVAQFNEFCELNALIGLIQADYMCIKCSDADIYEGRRLEYEEVSSFMYQSLVSGRRVALFRLTESIATKVGDIKYLMLCDQKSDGSQDDRVAYFEVVATPGNYETVVEKLKAREVPVKETVRPHFTSYDATLPTGFTVRIAKEAIIDKIKREEVV